jgi:4-coumarate--CoA ligase
MRLSSKSDVKCTGGYFQADETLFPFRFGELRSLTKRLAYGLVHRAQIGQDDVILAFSPNTILYPAFVQATQAATLCVTVCRLFCACESVNNNGKPKLANPGYLFDELVHHIKDSRPKVLVVGKPVFEVAKKAAAECGIPDRNIYVMEEEDHEGYKSIWSLVGDEELEPRRLSPQEAKERTAFMCYSSGTTGRAKGGMYMFI